MGNKIPKISVITPCFNADKYLRETLNCLLQQSSPDWECILVNDGSTDGTLQILQEYAMKDPRFVVIDKQNEGVAIARNVGVDKARGEYILPLDSDDIIEPSYIEKALSYFEENPQTKLVYCGARFFGDVNEPWNLGTYGYDWIIWDNSIFVSSIFRKEDFLAAGGYNPNMKIGFEDWDFLLSFLKKEDIVYRIPEELFFYRIHGISRGACAESKKEEMNRAIVQNHQDLYAPYFEELITWHNGYRDYKCRYDCIVNSVPYKIGCFIVAPAKWLRSLFKTIKR